MIKLENVNFKYKNGKQVLKNINLEIEEGEFISIIGKNGTGKSTLAKLISGIIEPTSGQILIDEVNTKNKKDYIKLRKKIGIVFQNPENQIIFNNVYDDIAFALNNLEIKDIKNKIYDALEKVNMKEYIQNESYELSLGQKQRITIAGVLAINPKYIVFDEPTTMIDSEGKEEVYKIIQTLKQSGYTIIYITNIIDEILMSDRIVMLDNGEIVHSFKKPDIIDNIEILKKYNIKVPEIVKAVKTLTENNIEVNLKEWTIEELVKGLLENR